MSIYIIAKIHMITSPKLRESEFGPHMISLYLIPTLIEPIRITSRPPQGPFLSVIIPSIFLYSLLCLVFIFVIYIELKYSAYRFYTHIYIIYVKVIIKHKCDRKYMSIN